jgi:hypothetical protein
MKSKRLLLGALLFSCVLCLEGRSETHETGRSRQAADPKPWSFADCQLAGISTEKTAPENVTATVQDATTGLFKERKLGVDLKLGAKRLQFDFYPNHPPSGKSALPTRIWTSAPHIKIDGKPEMLSVVYEERSLASGSEKIFVVPTKATKSTYNPKFRQYTVAMFTDTGKLVEAEITAAGKEFLTVSILRTCGDGFGLVDKLGKGTITVEPSFRTPSQARGELDLDRPTVTPVGTAYSQNETWLLQELVDRLAAR